MKLLFLHISDLHFKSDTIVDELKITKIIKAAISLGKTDRVIVVLSGDISNSGKKDEYSTAIHFESILCNEYKKAVNVDHDVFFLRVPGNHDVDFTENMFTATELSRLHKENLLDSKIQEGLARQSNYFDFAYRSQNCKQVDADKKMYDRQIIDIDGYIIEANLLNSCVFSTREEDKGLHYLPNRIIEEFCHPSEADLVLTVMHHAPDWFTDFIKNRLEPTINRKSSLAFYGHEHFANKKEVTTERARPIIIQGGGALCNGFDWEGSSFYAGVLDTETMEYNVAEFLWNSQKNQYERKQPFKIQLQPKPSNFFLPMDDFMCSFITDEYRNISKSFLDYYVFPRLQTEDASSTDVPREIKTISGLFVKAKILCISDETFYKFTNRNYLAYFVAKEVRSRYMATGDDRDLCYLLNVSCFGINADILLFLIYISDNTSIALLILKRALQYTADWDEFDFETNLPHYLNVTQLPTVNAPSADQEREKARSIEVEKERETYDAIQTKGIYDYSEGAAEEIGNKLIRSLSLLTIIARCLPSFEHIMRKDEKKQFSDAIYKLPNRIFGCWTNLANQCIPELVEYFEEQQTYFPNKPKVTRETILKAFQASSLTLLLDIYNLGIYYAAKPNVSDILLSSNLHKSITYDLERTMILERLGYVDAFIKNIIDANEIKTAPYHYVIQKVAAHALVFMKGIDYRNQDKIYAKIFPDLKLQKRLSFQRTTVKNDE